MSSQVNTERHVRDAACTRSTPGTTHTSPVSSARRHEHTLLFGLVPITILVVTQWGMFIGIWIRNRKLNHGYLGWKEVGSPQPMPEDLGYPPMRLGEAHVDAQLVLWLLPLAYDTTLVPGVVACAYGQRSYSIFVLCVSIFSFLMWTLCGSFNIMIHLAARELRWDPMFEGLFGAIAAFQILLGVLWLSVMIAGARMVDREKRDKWLGKRVERAVGRRLEEYRMQELPAYQA